MDSRRRTLSLLTCLTAVREIGQSSLDYGLEKSAVIRRYCLFLLKVGHLTYMVDATRLNSEARSCLISNKNHFQTLVLRTGKDKSPEADSVFSKASIWNFNDDKVKFDTNDVDNPNENYGSVSGFVPKSLLISTKGVLSGYPFVLL